MDETFKAEYGYPQRQMSLNNGAIWYLCIAPLFGLFLERYAGSWIVGLAVWIGCAVSMLAAAIIDLGIVSKCGFDTSKLRFWVWLSPVYIMKRERLCGREISKSALCGFLIFAAIAMNGFMMGLRVDGDYLTVSVQNSGVASMSNFSGSSASVIGDKITAYLGESAEWTNKKIADDTWEITASGKHKDDKYKVVFEIVHDGYAYKRLTMTKIIKNGEELSDDDFSDAAKEIFIK